MDVDSKIKLLKTDIQVLDDRKAMLEKRIAELKNLVEEKKKKESRLAELAEMERELLESLE